MSLSRRLLPSIASLRALEALDRLGSATAVAEELNQTQSAVSRQLQSLEAYLEADLILRERKRMTLTPAAQDYVKDVRAALQQIAQASLNLRVNPEGGSLNLAILPTFGMRWLVPRLSEFAQRHPEVTINMSTRLQSVNFSAEPFDAAIQYGEKEWPGTDRLRLMSEHVLPVCAPDLIAGQTLAHPRDLLSYPLLQIQTRPQAWAQWLGSFGVQARQLNGTTFDQFSTIIQAAIHGLGIALLPDYLAHSELQSGRLVPAYGSATRTLGSYSLVWPKEKARKQALCLFRDWLATQAETEDGLPR
ncbi:LysR family transcriptional regulator [Thalassobius sp. S69A]|uniref:LysR family transcriptional regulator n=1 Tax=unclassified Thalassovita TaxID=2619711 RepID=UPI000C3925F3|nr:LysR family transcriptional regulator [Paracoccaceae bacterium]